MYETAMRCCGCTFESYFIYFVIVYIHVQFGEHDVLYIRHYHYHLETITLEV